MASGCCRFVLCTNVSQQIRGGRHSSYPLVLQAVIGFFSLSDVKFSFAIHNVVTNTHADSKKKGNLKFNFKAIKGLPNDCRQMRLMASLEEPVIQFFCLKDKATLKRGEHEYNWNIFKMILVPRGIYCRRAGLCPSLPLIPLNLPATH